MNKLEILQSNQIANDFFKKEKEGLYHYQSKYIVKKWVSVESLLKWLERNFSMNGSAGDVYNKISEVVCDE
jgi:hypothetical protein